MARSFGDGFRYESVLEAVSLTWPKVEVKEVPVDDSRGPAAVPLGSRPKTELVKLILTSVKGGSMLLA